MFFRPDLSPDPRGLPVAARSIGETRVPAHGIGNQSPCHFAERMPARPLVQWLYSQAGHGSIIRSNGNEIPMPAGTLSWFYRDEPHHLTSDAAWHLRWWTMDGCLITPWLDEISQGREVIHLHHQPDPRLLQDIESLIGRPGMLAEATALMTHIILRAMTDHQPKTPTPATAANNPPSLPVQCARLISEQAHDSALTIQTLAAQLGVHRATLTRRCQRAWGYPPQVALQAERIQRGLQLLSAHTIDAQDHEPMPSIAAIAHQAGFDDPAYFSRLVKETTGFAPSKYRQHFT